MLVDYPGDLPFLSWLDHTIPASFDLIGDHLGADELRRARAEWEVLQPVLTREGLERAFPGVPLQAIHGDAPAYNMIGDLHADFESVMTGPREWDLTISAPAEVDAYNAAARQPLDERALEVCETARMLQILSCLALVPQLPMLADGLRPLVDIWRSMAQLTAI